MLYLKNIIFILTLSLILFDSYFQYIFNFNIFGFERYNNYMVSGFFNDELILGNRNEIEGRPNPAQLRGWDEDDDTNVDFANQMNWDIQNLPLYWTG